MKRFFCALLCAVLLVCACVPAFADTWLCKYCDKISNGNFCWFHNWIICTYSFNKSTVSWAS